MFFKKPHTTGSTLEVLFFPSQLERTLEAVFVFFLTTRVLIFTHPSVLFSRCASWPEWEWSEKEGQKTAH